MSSRSCIPLVLTILALLLVYGRWITPDLGWYDSAEFVNAACLVDIPHPPGYPLLNALNILAVRVPLGSNAAIRVHILALAIGAFAIGLVGSLAIRLTGNSFWGILVALVVGLSPRWIDLTTTAEVYPLEIVLLAAFLNLFLSHEGTSRSEWSFRWVLMTGGLLVVYRPTHLPFVGLTLLCHPDRSSWIRKSPWGLLGFVPHLLTLGIFAFKTSTKSVPWSINYFDYPRDGTTLFQIVTGTLYSRHFGFEGFDSLLNELILFLTFARSQLGVLGLAIGIYSVAQGLAHLRIQTKPEARVPGACPSVTRTLLLILVTNLGFFLNYHVIEKDTMYWPSVVSIVLMAVILLADRMPRNWGARWSLGPVVVIGLVLSWRGTELRIRQAPVGSRPTLETLVRSLPQGAHLIMGHDLLIHPMYHIVFVERRRTDLTLTVFEEFNDALIQTIDHSLETGKPVYSPLLVDTAIFKRVQDRYALQRHGCVWRLMNRDHPIDPPELMTHVSINGIRVAYRLNPYPDPASRLLYPELAVFGIDLSFEPAIQGFLAVRLETSGTENSQSESLLPADKSRPADKEWIRHLEGSSFSDVFACEVEPVPVAGKSRAEGKSVESILRIGIIPDGPGTVSTVESWEPESGSLFAPEAEAFRLRLERGIPAHVLCYVYKGRLASAQQIGTITHNLDDRK